MFFKPGAAGATHERRAAAIAVAGLHAARAAGGPLMPMMSALPRGIRAVAITQRGRGESSKPAGPYSTEALFEGAGHSPHWEEPERAARLVADLVVQTREAAQPAEATP